MILTMSNVIKLKTRLHFHVSNISYLRLSHFLFYKNPGDVVLPLRKGFIWSLNILQGCDD